MHNKLKIHNPPLYTAAASVYPYSKALESHFLVQTKYDPEPTFLAKKRGDFLLVPRELTPVSKDDRRSDGYPISFKLKVGPRDDMQKTMIASSIHHLKNGTSHTLQCVTGGGKCEAKDTPVLMFDGSIKMIQDVVVGDQLMGPDSTPRSVLSTTKGFGKMYKVTPVKGESFVCNDVHVLSLKSTTFQSHGKLYGGNTINIPINEYLTKSKKFKHLHKLWRTGVTLAEQPTTFDPYFFGLYVGDGGKDTAGITFGKKDVESYAYVQDWASLNNYTLTEVLKNNHRQVFLRYQNCVGNTLVNGKNENPLTSYIRKLGWSTTDRFIPSEYYVNSRKTRLSFLAGLLDSDGHKAATGNYEIITKYPSVKDAVLYTARSLGLAAYSHVCEKSIKSTDFTGTYFRIIISGDCSEIPIKLAYKQSTKRLQKKDVLVTGFSVEQVPDDFYYGFTLDGDSLYMHGDFTVTHNTYMSINLLSQLGKTALVVVPKEDLMVQWKQNLLKYTDLKEEDIGWIQQDKCDYVGKKVTIGMVHSLGGKDYESQLYDYFGILVLDEGHRMSASSFSQVMFKFNSKLRLSVTATPKRPDGKEFIFMAHSGPILTKSDTINVSPKVLVINSNWKLPTWKKRDPMTGTYTTVPIPHKAGRLAGIVKEMGKNDERNHLIADLAVKAYNKGRKTVIFFEQIDNHLRKVKPILIKMGIPPKDITEYIGGLNEQQRVDNAKGRIILGSYTYFSEGTDIPDLDTAILASPRSNVTQAVGRILRALEGKKQPVIFDIVDECSPVLVNSHHNRLRQYHALKAEIKKLT